MDRNEVTLEGELVADPTLRTTATGIPVANLRMRTMRPREQPGDWSPEYHSVVCWRGLSEVAGQLQTGDRLLLTAYLHTYKSTDPSTKRTRYGVEVVATSLEPLTLRTPRTEATVS